MGFPNDHNSGDALVLAKGEATKPSNDLNIDLIAAWKESAMPCAKNDETKSGDRLAFGPPVEGTESKEPVNTWFFDEKGNGVDRLRLRAEHKVKEADLLASNPDLKGKIDPADRTRTYNVRHATTGETDGDWKISEQNSDGTYSLSREYAIDVQSKENHNHALEAAAGVPKEFIDQVQKKLDQLPPHVMKSLERNGYKILATPMITDALPGLKRLTPRGWASDTTFDNSDGTHDNVRKQIIAPMRFVRDQSPEPVLRDNVVTHQIGHALDFANEFLSSRPEFIDAYNKDMQAIVDKRNPIYQYFSQPDGVGRQETFASLFGLLTTGTENESDRAYFERNFKNLIPVVRKQINELR